MLRSERSDKGATLSDSNDKDHEKILTKLHEVRNDLKDDLAGVYAHLKQDVIDIRRSVDERLKSGPAAPASAEAGKSSPLLGVAVILLLLILGLQVFDVLANLMGLY
jgi:hypothetical protein